jgi:tetratricopeptide (TPR) repeat protein
MPKRDAKDGGHTAFTDHRIQRQPVPEQPVTEDTDISAWREPADDSLRKRNLGIAYVQLGVERRSASFVVRGYDLLTDVQDSFSTDPSLYSWIGAALLPGKQYSEAQRAYALALQLDPASSTAEADLGQAYALAGDLENASHYFEDALQKDRLNLSVASQLMDIYGRQGDTAKAADLSKRMQAAMK